MRNVLIILLKIICMWWFSSLLLFSRFFLCLHFLEVWLWVSAWVSLSSSWSLFSFLAYIHILHQIQEVFSYYVFIYFLCPFLSSPSGTSTMFVLICSMTSHWPLRRCSLFFNPFLFVPQLWKWLLSYFKPSSKFFISFELFSFRLSFLFLFSFSLLVYFHFIHTLFSWLH